jgi:AraC-like DNA-binding protein
MSVKEIATVLGYDDAFYFSRQFKSVIGIAPSGYRMVRTSMKDELKPRRP